MFTKHYWDTYTSFSRSQAEIYSCLLPLEKKKNPRAVMTAESSLSHVVNSNEADRSGNLLMMNLLMMNSSHTSLIPLLCPTAC